METPEELLAFPLMLEKFRSQNDLEKSIELYLTKNSEDKKRWIAHLEDYEENYRKHLQENMLETFLDDFGLDF